VYPDYARGARIWGISPAQDQKIGAGVMMVEGSIVTLALFAWLFVRAGREGEERQALLDLAETRGVALDERRAARAVSAGRGDELRERIEREPV
jgi:cytochrome c oxidase assembly factor CtaG